MDFWKSVSPSLPREELSSEAQHLPGTRGGGAPPLQLASRVPGPVVMEKERGSQWTCARDPPRKQTEPSEGSLGRIRKGGLYTVVGCEAAGTSGSWEPQPPRRRGGERQRHGAAGRRAAGPASILVLPLCSLTCWCSHREPNGDPGVGGCCHMALPCGVPCGLGSGLQTAECVLLGLGGFLGGFGLDPTASGDLLRRS